MQRARAHTPGRRSARASRSPCSAAGADREAPACRRRPRASRPLAAQRLLVLARRSGEVRGIHWRQLDELGACGCGVLGGGGGAVAVDGQRDGLGVVQTF